MEARSRQCSVHGERPDSRAVRERQTSTLSATHAGSEGHARELPRWLDAEPLPQQLKIGNLPLGSS